MLMAVKRWRPYLQHQEFIIRTDHQSLAHLADQRLTTPIQQKAFITVLGLQYKLQYKKGSTNQVADALGRCFEVVETNAISTCIPKWTTQLIEGYKEDPVALDLITALAANPAAHDRYTLRDGLLRYKGRIYVGANSQAHNNILQALHSTGIGGHSRSTATYHRIKALFAWPHLKQDVDAYVKQCSICQQAKVEHVKLPGLLNPLPIPTQPWSIISMDFVEGLPVSGSYNSILVVIDKYSKYGHFIPLKHPYTAPHIAQVFVDNIYKLHGLSETIISDRTKCSPVIFGKHFLS